ncbi:tetratricopeptide repeat protein [uncultured Paracoccus sp.]|uniref:tetratricopeptide repeat protein n=1 Tax=uncultured Paracoccus sp. TaxID=189685 RepID=UPI00260B9AF1|nr:tetratricopeptide repeat protein [uncultured Paracoccus sp.]
MSRATRRVRGAPRVWRGLRAGVVAMTMLAPLTAAAQTAPDAPAQAPNGGETLADLRASLTVLAADLQSLRAELRAGGQSAYAAAGGESAIDRMNAMEAEIARLTAQAEGLRHRIERVVADGTTRLGDVEFRLCEMEEGCDLGALTTPPLGSQGDGAGMPFAAPPVPGSAGTASRGAEAAPDGAATAEEQAAFDRARAVFDAGDARAAAAQLADFAASHPGSPLTTEALWLQGAALEQAGQPRPAAAAWLQVFSADPNGGRAADALLGLGRLAAERGSTEQACTYLAEIQARFADSAQAAAAATEQQALSCPAPPAPDAAQDPEDAADAALVPDGG